MWGPDAVDAWARDEDVLSWRSLDTTQLDDVETQSLPPFDRVDDDEISEITSDAPDGDDLAEPIDCAHAEAFRSSRTCVVPNAPAAQGVFAPAQRQSNNAMEDAAWTKEINPPIAVLSNRQPGVPRTNAITLHIERRPEATQLKELPSTSEMINIPVPQDKSIEKSPSPSLLQGFGTRLSLLESSAYGIESGEDAVLSRYAQNSPSASSNLTANECEATHRGHGLTRAIHEELAMPWLNVQEVSTDQPAGEVDIARFHHFQTEDATTYDFQEHRPQSQPRLRELEHDLIQPPPQQQKTQRMPISLSELLAQKTGQMHAFSRNEEVANGLHAEEMWGRQGIHIQQLLAELENKNVQQIRLLQIDAKQWKEKYAHLETQMQRLQSSVLDMEKREAESHQLITQKSTEISALQIKCLSLQDTNENYQEQTKKAIEEKERVQRDYLQVVYDLGKTQKQLNAVSKEAASNTEKESLLREIDQLHRDNEQLQQRLKEAESRRNLGMPASQDTQQVASLQKHIQELEDEIRRLHFSGIAVAPSPPGYPSLNNSMGTKNSINQPLINQNIGSSRDCSPTNLLSMGLTVARREQPSYMNTQQPAHGHFKPAITLKDILAEQQYGGLTYRQEPPVSNHVASSRGSSVQQSLNFEQFKAEGKVVEFCSSFLYMANSFLAVAMDTALGRRNMGTTSSNMSDLLHQIPGRNGVPGLASSQSRSASFPPVDTGSLAPIATERQSFQLDAMEKRHLEQRLMNLQLEKDQMEAKVTKLEQTGLKTMSARSEKQWLDSRLQGLTQEISRLKLTLR